MQTTTTITSPPPAPTASPPVSINTNGAPAILAPALAPIPKPAAETASLPPALILLVDDRPDKLLALEAVLEAPRQILMKARSGKDALRLLLKHDFAVILLDVSMPGMDGFETAALIRQRPRSQHTPIIFITSINQSENHISQGYSLGAVDYLLTPIIPEILRSKVATFVDLHRQTQTVLDQGQQMTELNRILQQRISDLTSANEALAAFNYSIAHDLRAPLRAMSAFAGALLEDEAERLSELGREFAGRIHRGAMQMDKLLLDLLAYSALGRVEMDCVRVDLLPVLDEVMSVFDRQIRLSEAKVNVLPPLHAVYAHLPTLKQILANLIENGLKFVGAGRKPVLSILTTSTQGFTRIWVEDNGIGVPPQHQEKIFGLFKRLHDVQTYPGTGVGLALVRKGAERMGGHAGVESTPGEGSRFWVELPSSAPAGNGA